MRLLISAECDLISSLALSERVEPHTFTRELFPEPGLILQNKFIQTKTEKPGADNTSVVLRQTSRLRVFTSETKPSNNFCTGLKRM